MWTADILIYIQDLPIKFKRKMWTAGLEPA